MHEPEYKRAFTGSAYTTTPDHQVYTSGQSSPGYEGRQHVTLSHGEALSPSLDLVNE